MANVLSEGFEGSGYELSWSEIVGTGDTVDEDNTDVTPPTGGGSQVLKIIQSATSTGSQTQHDHGSEESVTYSRMYFQINADSLVNYGFSTLLVGMDDSANIVCRLMKRRDGSGDLRFRFHIYNNGTDNWYEGDIITFDQWYKLEMKYDDSGNTWEWRVDGVSQDSGSLTGTHYTGIRYWRISSSYQADEEYTAYWDLLEVDDSGYPADPSAGTILPQMLQHHGG